MWREDAGRCWGRIAGRRIAGQPLPQLLIFQNPSLPSVSIAEVPVCQLISFSVASCLQTICQRAVGLPDASDIYICLRNSDTEHIRGSHALP